MIFRRFLYKFSNNIELRALLHDFSNQSHSDNHGGVLVLLLDPLDGLGADLLPHHLRQPAFTLGLGRHWNHALGLVKEQAGQEQALFC